MREQAKKILSVPVYTFFSKNRMAIAFSVALITLAVSGLFAFRIVLQLKDDHDTVAQKYEMLKELDQVLAQVSLSQTEIRSFYLTSDSTYLTSYRLKQDSIRSHFSLLLNPLNIRNEQVAHLRALDSLIELRDRFNEQKLEYFRLWGQQSAEQEFSIKQSQQIVRQIDRLVHTIDSEEKELLSLRKSATTTQVYRALLVITFGGLIGVFLFVIVFLLLNAEIRQRSKAEEQLRDSEKRVLSFLEAIPAGVFILTPDGTPYYANEEAKNILGDRILPKPGSGERFEMYKVCIQGTDTVYPLELIPIMRALKGERSSISDIEVWKPDAIVPLIVTGTPIYDPRGTLQYAMAVFLDNTEQKRAEQGLADSEERFRQIIENASDIIYRTDHRGNFTYVNPTGLRMMGYSISEVVGMHFTLFVKSEDQQKVAKQYFRQMLTKTKSSYMEFPALKRNGEEVILGQSVELLFDKNTVTGFLAIARNITERKLVEEEISRRQQQLDTVVMTVDEGITLSDESGRFEIFNAKMEELTGYSKDEANQGEFTKLLYPDPEEQKRGIERLGEVVEKGFIHDVETNVVSKSGEEKTLLISTRIVHVKDKVMYLSAYRDITSRKRFEEELKKAKDSAESATVAKSQFLATMSHEIRTPMNGVIGMTDLLMQSELNPEQREYTEIIRTSGETLLTLINDILDFSKIESGKLDMEKRPIDLQNLIEETFDLVARRAVEKRLDLV
ncbi:MAG: PAS domain S-box protein, partial [Bacteroidota bacterium]